MRKTAVVCAALMLTACASLKVTIQTADGINANADGVSSPVRVKIFELKSKQAFEEASYDALFNQNGHHFDTDVIKTDEFSLFPSQQLKIERPLMSGAKTLGIVAAYTVLPRLPWKKTIQVAEKDFYIDRKLNILVSETGLVVN